MALGASAGAAHPHVAVHPGALNAADSAAYDTLLVAESMIDQARVESQAGNLPPGAKAPLDKLILSYNAARDSWLTYRGAVANNVEPETYAVRLTSTTADLVAAIRVLKEAKWTSN